MTADATEPTPLWTPDAARVANARITAFAQHAEQRLGRAIWWDRRVDRAAEADYSEARVRQQACGYQPRQR